MRYFQRYDNSDNSRVVSRRSAKANEREIDDVYIRKERGEKGVNGGAESDRQASENFYPEE